MVPLSADPSADLMVAWKVEKKVAQSVASLAGWSVVQMAG